MTPEGKKLLKRRLLIILIIVVAITAIYFTALLIYRGRLYRQYPAKYIDRKAVTVAERFRLPDGFERDAGGSETAGAALKKFGLAAYHTSGMRNFDAGLWGVFADKVALLPNGFGPCEPAELLPGTVLKISKAGDDLNVHFYLIADLCRDAAGNVRVLLAVYEPGCEVYITVPAETGAEKYAGCWFDLSRSFPEAGGWTLEKGI